MSWPLAKLTPHSPKTPDTTHLDPEPNLPLIHSKPHPKPHIPWPWAKFTPHPPKTPSQALHAWALTQIDPLPTQNFISNSRRLDLEPNQPFTHPKLHLKPHMAWSEPNWHLSHSKPRPKPLTPWPIAKLIPHPPKTPSHASHALAFSQSDPLTHPNPYQSPTHLDPEPDWPFTHPKTQNTIAFYVEWHKKFQNNL
jgi:hypothetical protein